MREEHEVKKMIALLTARIELIEKLNRNAEQLNTTSNHLEYAGYDCCETEYCKAHRRTLEWVLESEER